MICNCFFGTIKLLKINEFTKQIGDYFSRRFPFFTIFSNTSYPELASIAYMQAMAESAIMQGNRNVLVKQKMLNFVRNHPSDLASVSDVWLQYDSVADEWKPFYAFGRESKG